MARTQSGQTYRWALTGLGGLVETMEMIASEGAVMASEDVGDFGSLMKRLGNLYDRESTRTRGNTDQETEEKEGV